MFLKCFWTILWFFFFFFRFLQPNVLTVLWAQHVVSPAAPNIQFRVPDLWHLFARMASGCSNGWPYTLAASATNSKSKGPAGPFMCFQWRQPQGSWFIKHDVLAARISGMFSFVFSFGGGRQSAHTDKIRPGAWHPSLVQKGSFTASCAENAPFDCQNQNWRTNSCSRSIWSRHLSMALTTAAFSRDMAICRG